MRKIRGYPTENNSSGYPGEPVLPEGQPYYGASYPAAAYPPVPDKRPGRTVLRLVIFLLIATAALIVLQTMVFRLQTVYIIGNRTIAAEHIAALSGLVKGDSIFSVSEEKVRDSLAEDHWIVLNHMYKQYPNEVYLFVGERSVVATMQWLGIQYTLDIDGMVLDEYSDMDYRGDVPTVFGFSVSNAAVGEPLAVRASAQLVAYSSIVSELTIQRYEDQVVSINVSDPEALSMLTESGITVQLGNSDYMRAKIGAMRTDIAYLQQLGEAKGVLDVTVPEDGKFRRE